MCQGVRDVANLCWKLGAVLRGEAGDALLDTYGTERKGHVTELTTRIKDIGQIICERDPVRARARDAQLLQDCGGVVKPTPRQDVQPALQNGLLAQLAHPARGTIFPQPWLMVGGDKKRMDDVLGAGWRLILAANAGMDAAQAACLSALPDLKVAKLGTPELTEAEGVLAHWFERYGVMAAIVRPDHYVYGVADAEQALTQQLTALRLR
jgi:3-(3-hydroxy-phenyl)propionate hydroxylase